MPNRAATLANIAKWSGDKQRDAMTGIVRWLGFDTYPHPSRIFSTFIASQLSRELVEPIEIESDWVFDGGGEAEFDAAHIDTKNRVVFVLQGKARTADKNETKRDDWGLFLRQALSLLPDTNFDAKETIKEVTNPTVKRLLRKAVSCLEKPDWKLHICFATLGTADVGAIQQTIDAAGTAATVELDVLTISEVAAMINERPNPFADPVWQIRLTAVGPYIETTYPIGGRNESLIVAQVHMTDLVREYQRYREALFEANVRGYLGENKDPSVQIIRHVYHHPESFHLMHNGVTVVARAVRKDGPQNNTELTLQMPSIVNGQQTIRTMATLIEDGNWNKAIALPDLARTVEDQVAKAQVVVKIVLKNDDLLNSYENHRGPGIEWNALSQEIAYASNHQTAIDYADLRSNDLALMKLSNDCLKVGLFIQRKKMTKGNLRTLLRIAERRGGDSSALDDFDANTISIAVCAVATHLGAFTGKYGKNERFGQDPFRRKDRQNTLSPAGPGSMEDPFSLFEHVFANGIDAKDIYLMTLLHAYVLRTCAVLNAADLGNSRSAVARLVWGEIAAQMGASETNLLTEALRRERFAGNISTSRSGARKSLNPKHNAVLDNLGRLTEETFKLAELRWTTERANPNETMSNFYKGLPGTKLSSITELKTETNYAAQSGTCLEEVEVLLASLR